MNIETIDKAIQDGTEPLDIAIAIAGPDCHIDKAMMLVAVRVVIHREKEKQANV